MNKEDREIRLESLAEYLIKFFHKGEEEIHALTTQELLEVLRTGELDGEEVARIYFNFSGDIISYDFTTRAEGTEKGYGWNYEG